MHQLLEPVAFGRIAKHDVPQGRPIEGAITLEHGPGRFSAWGQGFPGKVIGIQHGQAMVLLQQLPHRAFACGNAAGQADAPLGPLPAGAWPVGRLSHGVWSGGQALSDAQVRSMCAL